MAHTVRRIGILIILVTALQFAAQVTSLPLPDFFPFGPNFGDQTLPSGNEESATVVLQQAFPFYGETRGFITVSCSAASSYSSSGFRNYIAI